jgi:hypothetical protein
MALTGLAAMAYKKNKSNPAKNNIPGLYPKFNQIARNNSG